ncbi:MAG: response regulator [Xanthobacteraceae bacterium]
MDSAITDILAIDDDEDTIEGLLSEFDLLGYSFEIARTLIEAKNKLQHNKYKILLVDLRMKSEQDGSIKDDGGLELIRKLRKGKLGAVNQNASYVIISAQQFLLDRLEAKISNEELANIREGRLAKFSKGDSLNSLVQRVATVLSHPERQ